jgi:hypothetical protein
MSIDIEALLARVNKLDETFRSLQKPAAQSETTRAGSVETGEGVATVRPDAEAPPVDAVSLETLAEQKATAKLRAAALAAFLEQHSVDPEAAADLLKARGATPEFNEDNSVKPESCPLPPSLRRAAGFAGTGSKQGSTLDISPITDEQRAIRAATDSSVYRSMGATGKERLAKTLGRKNRG